MVVSDGASTGIGAIWYQMKLIPEEAESWYRMKLVPEEAKSWYRMNAKVVSDHCRVLDDMECGY